MRKLFTLFIVFLFNGTIISQIYHPGLPPSAEMDQTVPAMTLHLDRPDIGSLMAEDQENEELGFPAPPRMGVGIPVDIDPATTGTWTLLEDGSRIWKLELVSPDALALGVNFENLLIPEGGELYFYTPDMTMVSGAFTYESNTPFGAFSSDFIKGDRMIIEYFSPAQTTDEPVLEISEIVYAYSNIWFNYDYTRDASWPCMINVACEEGDGWEDQIKGITKLSIKIGMYYYWCSGSLINNTNHDRSPYVLTAAHCGEGATTSDLLYWKFYFNNEASLCTGNYGPTNQFITGCTFKAKDPSYADNGSDFYLVLLNQTIPDNFGVFYNGWNRTNIPAADTSVGIHHPAGDIKKISTSWQMISSAWWNGLPSHWRIQWAETINGRSIMQGGSSGSPIFDEEGYIMGDLTGGYQSNSCSNPSPAWYGKLWYSWDQNGTTASTRLKDWLDPTNTGIEKLIGIHHAALPPAADFTANPTTVLQGEDVQFTDLSTGNPATSWMWVFENGVPDTSYEQNPSVHYFDYGTFDVTLTVTNPDGTDTEMKSDYITVEQITPPTADFSSNTDTVTEGGSVQFVDLSTDNPTFWFWEFEGGEPDTSFDQFPEVEYNLPGTYDVILTASNLGGDDQEIKTDYITVLQGVAPSCDFIADVTEIMVGDTVHFTDLSTGDPDRWTWNFEGGNPSVVYNEEGLFDAQLFVRNSFGNDLMVKEDYIHVGPVTVRELNENKGIYIYPNPATGIVNLMIKSGAADQLMISIYDASGTLVNNIRPETAVDRVRIDMTGLEAGLYYVRVNSGNTIHTGKIALIR